MFGKYGVVGQIIPIVITSFTLQVSNVTYSKLTTTNRSATLN